ncbi:MAG: OsmC family protein [Flavobacterium sp.]|nr:OsmC family protein [Flavobacterium sp.]
MNTLHSYKLSVKWTGNQGIGTSNYKDFDRSYSIQIKKKAHVLGSAHPQFRGDKTKHNPQELLLASVSSCHMLWYLHLCAEEKIVVTDYVDNATAILEETKDGNGKFSSIILNPTIMVSEKGIIENATALYKKANEFCFVANSLNIKVDLQPIINSQD